MILSFMPIVSVLSLALELVSSSPLSRRSPAPIFTSCTEPNTVALTFDDGPSQNLNDLVRILNENQIKGTFFFNGDNFVCIYEESMSNAVKAAFDGGHQIASHTWGHKRLTNLTWDEIHDEMFRAEQALERITGALPAIMRPPFGETNDLVLQAAGIRDQTIVNWDFDSEDGKSATVEAQKTLYDEAIGNRPLSILSLQHEVHETSVFEVLPYAIEKLRGAGYRFVTVSECLGGLSAYQRVGEPQVRDDTWTC